MRCKEARGLGGPTHRLILQLRTVHGRLHGFESGGTILRAERAKKIDPPLLASGGQNIA